MGICDSTSKREQNANANSNNAKSEISNNINEIKSNNSASPMQNNTPNVEKEEAQMSRKLNPQSTENEQNNYYLVCPNCNAHSPYIKKIDFNNNNFTVSFKCVCFANPGEIAQKNLSDLLSTAKPSNICVHHNQKLTKVCTHCELPVCGKCQEGAHFNHAFQEMQAYNKDEAARMLENIELKEKLFNKQLMDDAQKMENGFDDAIKRLNEEKETYKNQMQQIKNGNQKTFDFLKTLYSRGTNDANNPNGSQECSQNLMCSTDVLLQNHLNNFAIQEQQQNNILNSNVDDILKQYPKEPKNLQLKIDYGFNSSNVPKTNFDSNQNPSPYGAESNAQNTVKSIREFSDEQPLPLYVCKTTLKGHADKIVSITVLQTGELATGSYDNTIKIWNLYLNKCVKTINESGYVLSLLEFETCKLLSGTSANNIRIWDLNSPFGEPLFNFEGHQLWINCLVRCDQRYFASGSNDATIKVWDYYNKTCIRTLKGHVDCVLALAAISGSRLCSGSADLTIRIWDWMNNQCLSICRGHDKWVKCVFEMSNGTIISGSDDKTIKLWRGEKCLGTLEGHTHSIRSFCQINNDIFVSGSFDRTIKLWDINSLKCLQTLTGHKSNVIAVICIGNGEIASCSNDKTIKIWGP